jgi:hypothetical protein
LKNAWKENILKNSIFFSQNVHPNYRDLNLENEVSQDVLKKLDNGFRRLTWSRRQFSHSLVKRFLTKTVFKVLKHRSTTLGTNLHEVIKSGIEHLDSKVGAYGMDIECYRVFRPILHPIICTIHQTTPKVTHPKKSDWTDINHIGMCIQGYIWPVHLVWMTARLQQDTFLSWHLAPASEVAGGHTLPF